MQGYAIQKQSAITSRHVLEAVRKTVRDVLETVSNQMKDGLITYVTKCAVKCNAAHHV